VRVALIGVRGFLAFYGYGCQRTSSGPLSRSVGQKLFYAVKTAGMIGQPSLFVITPALSVYLYLRSGRPKKLLRAGLCPKCGYPLVATHAVCPECGRLPGEFNDTTLPDIRRFLAIAAITLLWVQRSDRARPRFGSPR